MSGADISGIASITFCQVTDLNFPQLIACFNYLAHVLALGTISSKSQLKWKLLRDLKKLLLKLREPSVYLAGLFNKVYESSTSLFANKIYKLVTSCNIFTISGRRQFQLGTRHMFSVNLPPKSTCSIRENSSEN